MKKIQFNKIVYDLITYPPIRSSKYFTRKKITNLSENNEISSVLAS